MSITVCSACGQSFACGRDTSACHCQQLPALPSTDSARTCYCPTCLKNELKKYPLLFGIANCDRVKKARSELQQKQISHVFWDYKKYGVPADWLAQWCVELGWQALLNRAGTTWRGLSPSEQASVIDAASAVQLMCAHPSLIKRPVWWWQGQLSVGSLAHNL